MALVLCPLQSAEGAECAGAGQSGASLPRSTIIAIAVSVAGGVVILGILLLLVFLMYAAPLQYSLSNLIATFLGRCPGC